MDSKILAVASLGYMLAGYTAYDKQRKVIDPALLLDVVLFRKGLMYAAVEVNKAISLVAILLLGVSQAPQLTARMTDGGAHLLSYSFWLVVAHSLFSAAYFGWQRSPKSDVALLAGATGYVWNGPTRKRMDLLRMLSIALGLAASLLLLAAMGSALLWSLFLALSSWLALAHFWSMEVDFKLQLQGRPAAYIVALPYLLAIISRLT
jgi:hypothetical protein